MLLRPATDQRIFVALMLALITLAWIALVVWSTSPYAHYLEHAHLEGSHLAARTENLALLSVFVGGWTLMTVAMMLPTSLPLLTLFRRMTRARTDGRRLVVILIGGYLVVWAIFGGLAYIGDVFVHELVHRIHWLHHNPWAISATLLIGAGIYQFTPLKYACLDKCRSPFSFINEHWRGRNETLESLWLGIRHGAYCVGCCWTLMLLMFAVGCGNIAWMLGLGAIMAAEKNLPWGRKLSMPLGIVLLLGGGLVALTGVPLAAH